jgi:hypothetical protein
LAPWLCESRAHRIPFTERYAVVKKLLPILVLLGACAPDIQQDPAPSTDVVIVNFDPSHTDPATGQPDAIVPLPNDLARADAATGVIAPGAKIHVPPPPSSRPYPDAQKEFDQQYLETLDGFPYESTASVTTSGDLKPDTVNARTILAFDVTNPAVPMPVVIVPTFANKTITIPPPAGNWTRAHTYAIAAVGGANGLRGAGGQDVLGSQTWILVSSRNPLVTCPDLKTNCAPAIDIIPSTQTDPDAKFKDQTAKAIQLEQLRRGYAPILDALGAAPLAIPRKDIPIVWTFTIVDAGEVTFDPANKVIPFPNDLVRTGPKGTVQLPNPKTGMPLTAADCMTTDNSILLVCGLNTLDGFSTLAPLISENSDKAGAVDQALIDGKTLDPKTVGLVKLKSGAPMAIQTTPKYTPCLNCQSSTKADGTPVTTPQQLQWKLDAPLDEKTTYFGYVSNGVKDTMAKPVVANPVLALVRSSATLLDNSKCDLIPPATVPAPCDKSTSTVNLISVDQAKQLEPVRAAFKAAFDALEMGNVHRTDLALAFPFTTQSESTILDVLYAAPTQLKALGLKDFPQGVVKATAQIVPVLDAGMIPHGNILDFYAGQWLTPVGVTGPGGTLNPNPTLFKDLPVQFTMSIPDPAKGPMPAGGWPVTIFGHGFTRSRNDFLAFANAAAAAGQAVISTDVLFHGERTSCTGVKASIPMATDDSAACANPATMKCDEGFVGLCVLTDTASRMACSGNTSDPLGDGACAAVDQGRCAADHLCQGRSPVGTASACTNDLAGALLCGSLGQGSCDGGTLKCTKGPLADFRRDGTGKPLDSGWNIFSLTNFFATRDNFRQQVIDLSQLVNVLKSSAATNIGAQIAAANGGTAIPLDVTKLNYVGQSLGGILGTLFNSVSPDTNNVVLNVPGGALVSIILNAPSFVSAKAALISTLAASGLQPGTPGFDQFLGIAQWVLDEADPANMGYRLTHPVTLASGGTAPNANRKVFIQFIEGDETVPNISNFALVAGANRDFVPTPPSFGCKPPLFCYEFTVAGGDITATSAPTNKRHGFLLSPPSDLASGGFAITAKAQTQAAKFLATGTFP